jgi:hypothetical protein
VRRSFDANIHQCGSQVRQSSGEAGDRNLRAEMKDRAKYNEMSMWAQHKAVKKCVADALAKH